MAYRCHRDIARENTMAARRTRPLWPGYIQSLRADPARFGMDALASRDAVPPVRTV